METALIVCLALLADAVLGEPRRFHPLNGFAALAGAIEKRCYRDSIESGVLALFASLIPLLALAMAIGALPFTALNVALNAVVLYLALGWTSLASHAGNVQAALASGDLPLARRRVAMLVSRNTDELDAEGVAGATIESVLENGNDAIFGAIFWFVLAGLPGVLLYRLSNTLDAMWGYRSERYLRFGRAAARLDDLLNYVPARITALTYALVGKTGRALGCWKAQGPNWKSTNAGSVMASGAGSLGLVLGGSAVYGGVDQNRPQLGAGRPPRADDIKRALNLIRRTLLLWVVVLLAGGWFAPYIV